MVKRTNFEIAGLIHEVVQAVRNHFEMISDSTMILKKDKEDCVKMVNTLCEERKIKTGTVMKILGVNDIDPIDYDDDDDED